MPTIAKQKQARPAAGILREQAVACSRRQDATQVTSKNQIIMAYQRLTWMLLALALAYLPTASAQEEWSLERCVQHAIQNNLGVRQAQYNAKNAALTGKQSRADRLPTLNGSVSGGYQLGRTIDPTSNEFRNESIGFNSYGLNLGVTLYGGNRINNSIKQANIDEQVALLDAQNTANNTALAVANAYLSILLAEEQLENSRNRLEQSGQQLAQTERLISAGARPENERLDFVATQARDEQLLIEAQNLLDISYLNLKQLLLLPPDAPMSIVRPTVVIPPDADPDAYTLAAVYQVAQQTQPQLKARSLAIESARVSESIARAGLMPTLSLFASLNTNFSTVARDFANPDLSDAVPVPNTVPVIINGQNAQLTTFGLDGIIFPRQSYLDQVNQNFGQSIGLSLSVPIYNNGRSRIGMERARLGVLNAEVQSNQTEQQLKSDIQSAIANAKAARRAYAAAQRSADASAASLDNAQKRFDLGVINSLEFATARNAADQAAIDVIRARYQYLFNLKVIDFYMGRPVKL